MSETAEYVEGCAGSACTTIARLEADLQAAAVLKATNEWREKLAAADRQIVQLGAELVEAQRETEYNLENAVCIHCGIRTPNEEVDHWERCESHPARKRLEKVEAELAEAQSAAKQWESETERLQRLGEQAEAELAAAREELAWCRDSALERKNMR